LSINFAVLADPSLSPDDLADASEPELVRLVQNTAQDRLNDIQDARNQLTEDPEKVWDAEGAIERAKQALAIRQGTVYSGIIANKLEHIAHNRLFRDLFLGALGIAITVATVGAAAPIVAAGALGVATVSGLALYYHYDEYRTQQAFVGSDFDRAHALSANEPSLFWLALDIVGFGLDLGAAASAFTRLAGLARATRLAGTEGRSATDLAQRVEELQRAGNEVHEGLGNRLAEHAAQTGSEESALLRTAATRGEARLASARDWARRAINAPLSVLRDLTELAIERLRRLPQWVLERLSSLSEGLLRRALGCSSPCRVNIEELMAVLRELDASGRARGPVLGTAAEVLNALPSGNLNLQRITRQLNRHPGILTAIREAGLTAEDFGGLSRFLSAADLENPVAAYETFSGYVRRAAAARIGPNPAELQRVMEAIRRVEPQSAGANLRGYLFQDWARMHLPEFQNVAFESILSGQRLRPDRWVPSRGEIWDFKYYLSARPGDAVRADAVRPYLALIGQEFGGNTVRSINYVFPTLEVARVNYQAIGRLNPAINIFYLGPDLRLVPFRP
jgi:hypothetical protein